MEGVGVIPVVKSIGEQLYEIFTHASLTHNNFYGRLPTRLNQLKHLIGDNLLDSELYWMSEESSLSGSES